MVIQCETKSLPPIIHGQIDAPNLGTLQGYELDEIIHF
jgi:hypothetical protein